MHLNPYGQDAVRLAVALANNRPTTVADLVTRCAAAGLVIDMPVGDRDLTEALELVDQWCRIVDAPDEVQRAELVNGLLAAASAYPRLTNHEGSGWHLHYRDDGVPLAAVLRALVGVGTALHLAGRGMSRLGRCALADCATVYVDTSRGGRQRYCSPGCANRDAVRRHRALHAPNGHPGPRTGGLT
ncbi:CGNR zinc finger domain-containing protein [Micromonospora pisi]|uniref:CGNR zinc finger domain-containing protein n=1 Tax=Micromonospora pisi TaxID=589240 RepID=UPI000EB04688|nr:CGNR zinc finger domain-containing protein [Micromonospora pisi]